MPGTTTARGPPATCLSARPSPAEDDAGRCGGGGSRLVHSMPALPPALDAGAESGPLTLLCNIDYRPLGLTSELRGRQQRQRQQQLSTAAGAQAAADPVLLTGLMLARYRPAELLNACSPTLSAAGKPRGAPSRPAARCSACWGCGGPPPVHGTLALVSAHAQSSCSRHSTPRTGHSRFRRAASLSLPCGLARLALLSGPVRWPRKSSACSRPGTAWMSTRT